MENHALKNLKEKIEDLNCLGLSCYECPLHNRVEVCDLIRIKERMENHKEVCSLCKREL